MSNYRKRYMHRRKMGYSVAKAKRMAKGCYIATAVYGTYDCPNVWVLRRYRDYVLETTWYGRIFIKIYYSISPKLVKTFGGKKWFNSLWKSVLDKKVKRLKSEGFDDTAYID